MAALSIVYMVCLSVWVSRDLLLLKLHDFLFGVTGKKEFKFFELRMCGVLMTLTLTACNCMLQHDLAITILLYITTYLIVDVSPQLIASEVDDDVIVEEKFKK